MDPPHCSNLEANKKKMEKRREENEHTKLAQREAAVCAKLLFWDRNHQFFSNLASNNLIL